LSVKLVGKKTNRAAIGARIYWPTSGTNQVFHNIPADAAIEIVECADPYRKLDAKAVPVPR
jgi:hypothetical protein